MFQGIREIADVLRLNSCLLLPSTEIRTESYGEGAVVGNCSFRQFVVFVLRIMDVVLMTLQAIVACQFRCVALGTADPSGRLHANGRTFRAFRPRHSIVQCERRIDEPEGIVIQCVA